MLNNRCIEDCYSREGKQNHIRDVNLRGFVWSVFNAIVYIVVFVHSSSAVLLVERLVKDKNFSGSVPGLLSLILYSVLLAGMCNLK